jgi:hypothetical protein
MLSVDRLIKVKSRIVPVIVKNKSWPGKVRYLTKKEIEGEVMEKEIKVIDTEGLTGAESIYEAFIKNDWKPLSSSQLAHSTKKNIGSIGALVSTFCKNNMLIRHKEGPKKFYYTVSEDCQGIGRIGWGNMFREFVNRERDGRKKKKKKQKPSVSHKAKKIAETKRAQVTIKTPDHGIMMSSAQTFHRCVDKLNLALKNVILLGLKVDIQIVDCDYEGRKERGLMVDHRVYREF